LWEAGEKQIGLARESADVAKQTLIATNRAWLTVDVTLARDHNHIIFDSNGAVLPIRIDMKNVGNAPAVKVSWHAWVVFEGNRSNAIQEQALRCDRIRQQPFGIGPTIFPQERFPDPDLGWSFGAGTSWEEINAAVPREAGGGQIARIVSLIGCVDYTFPADPDVHHQTGFVLFVRVRPFQVPQITETGGNTPIAVGGLTKRDMTLTPGAD
jgi:hypothetical protein